MNALYTHYQLQVQFILKHFIIVKYLIITIQLVKRSCTFKTTDKLKMESYYLYYSLFSIFISISPAV